MNPGDWILIVVAVLGAENMVPDAECQSEVRVAMFQDR